MLICGIYILPRLCQYWEELRREPIDEGLYWARIDGIRLWLPELQGKNQAARKIRQQGLKQGWIEVKRVLHFQGLPYIAKTIWTELISRHHNDPLAGHFGIERTRELVTWKYYWPTLRADIEVYVKRYDIWIASKTVKYKPYKDLQSLPMFTHCWKDLSIDFVTGLLVSTNWKGETYDSILVIVDRLIKMVYYKLVKVIINTPGLAEIIIDVVVKHYGLSDLIVSNQSSVFTFKFWSLLCYFLGIKQRLFTIFHPQTDS